jgi:transposase-like protein
MDDFIRPDFDREFPDDAACLGYLFHRSHPRDLVACPSKACGGKQRRYYPLKERAAYRCDECGNQIYPMKGTIFAHSSTPLRVWFLAIFLVATTRTGFPAKWLQRECGVTYKTAWRMLKQVRSMLDEAPPMLRGEVEVDETWFGGKKHGSRGLSNADKTKIIGLVERGGRGRAYTELVPNVRAISLVPVVRRYVEPGSTVYTDELKSYKTLPSFNFKHEAVSHWQKKWVIGRAHTNTVENFWSNFKRNVDGAHRQISRKYLQSYLDEYAFRRTHRNDETPLFWTMLRQVTA